MDLLDSDKFILFFMDRANLWKLFYDEIGNLNFLETMNWGYSKGSKTAKISNYIIPVTNSCSDINSFNLYHYLIETAIDKADYNVKPKKTHADIGCGKGGGLNFVNRVFKFDKSIGYDFSNDGLIVAKKTYTNSKLDFQYLDVRELKECEKVDIVSNVESFHCYGSKSMFFENCYNMLNDDGILAMTDFIDVNKMHIIGEEASDFFDLLYLEDISPNVILSLNQKIRTNDTKIGIKKIKERYPFVPDAILDKVAFNFSGEQNRINMINNKTVYFIAIFIKKTVRNSVLANSIKDLTKYVDLNIFDKGTTPEYLQNVCNQAQTIIENTFFKERHLPVATVICDPIKLPFFESIASLNYTAPYYVKDYKKLCNIQFNNECIDYKYHTITPPFDNVGIEKTGVYKATEFKKLIKSNEYIAHEKMPFKDSYKTIEDNVKDKVLKGKMESYYYGSNKGSKLHNDNSNSYVLQLTGQKKWTIYNPNMSYLLKPFLTSMLTTIFFKNATDESNSLIPSFNITLNKNDLLVVPYGLPHEVICIPNVVTEHCNYRGTDNQSFYCKNSKLLNEQDVFYNKISRNYFNSVVFNILKTVHTCKDIHNLFIPIDETINDFYNKETHEYKSLFENSSVKDIINGCLHRK